MVKKRSAPEEATIVGLQTFSISRILPDYYHVYRNGRHITSLLSVAAVNSFTKEAIKECTEKKVEYLIEVDGVKLASSADRKPAAEPEKKAAGQIHMVVKEWKEFSDALHQNIAPYADKAKADAFAHEKNKTKNQTAEEVRLYTMYFVETFDIIE